jgi:hypothetical protein
MSSAMNVPVLKEFPTVRVRVDRASIPAYCLSPEGLRGTVAVTSGTETQWQSPAAS